MNCCSSLGLLSLICIALVSIGPKIVVGRSYKKMSIMERFNTIDYVNATACDSSDDEKCKLPKCRCGSTSAPDNLAMSETPQIFMISFGGGVNAANYDIYQRVFNNRKNPNGCPIRGTFFVSHEWTDYNLVQNLYYQGHEIASQTVSSTQMGVNGSTVPEMLLEIDGQRQILSEFANIPSSDIRGMRSPGLHPAGDAQFEALWRKNYLYDSSLTVVEYDPPMFPYTFDYALPHQCNVPPCPTKSYPGLWEVPLIAWRDLTDLPCTVADACINIGNTSEEMYSFFQKNFDRHYTSNRAPISAYFHAGWFAGEFEYRLEAFLKFVDDILKQKDVWFVSATDTVMWMKTAVPLPKLDKLKAWQCDQERKLSRKRTRKVLRLKQCGIPNHCKSKFRDSERYWKTCSACPEVYPWLGNPKGVVAKLNSTKSTSAFNQI